MVWTGEMKGSVWGSSFTPIQSGASRLLVLWSSRCDLFVKYSNRLISLSAVEMRILKVVPPFPHQALSEPTVCMF